MRNHIQISQLIYMGLRDLWSKRFRSTLTVLGVTVGIGSIYFLLSLGFGLQNLVQGQIIDSKQINTIDVTTSNSEVLPISQTTLNRIKGMSHVTTASGVYTYAGQATVDGATADTVIYGVQPSYKDLTNISLVAGSFIGTNDHDIVVDNTLLQAVGIKKSTDAIGKSIAVEVEVGGVTHKDSFTIVGVSQADSGFEAFITQGLIQSYGETSFTQVKVEADDRSNIPNIRKVIESQGYETASPVDTLDQINQVFKYFNLILGGFGSIGLLIAVLGMLNTLTVSLLERTQEIALMIALGARTRDMRRLFITEGVMLSLVGGVIGIIGASLLGFIIDLVLKQFAVARGVGESFSVFATPPLLVVGILIFTCIVGYLVALVPARRAAKINTIEALRHE